MIVSNTTYTSTTTPHLADPNGGGGAREPWHAGLEGSNVRERSTSTRVDGTHSELVGLSWLELHSMRLERSVVFRLCARASGCIYDVSRRCCNSGLRTAPNSLAQPDHQRCHLHQHTFTVGSSTGTWYPVTVYCVPLATSMSYHWGGASF